MAKIAGVIQALGPMLSSGSFFKGGVFIDKRSLGPVLSTSDLFAVLQPGRAVTLHLCRLLTTRVLMGVSVDGFTYRQGFLHLLGLLVLLLFCTVGLTFAALAIIGGILGEALGFGAGGLMLLCGAWQFIAMIGTWFGTFSGGLPVPGPKPAG